MRFEEWEPLYREILKEFGYDRAGDERAAVLLDELLKGERATEADLSALLRGRDVLVAGNGPNLEAEWRGWDGPVIAADEATSFLLRRDTVPQLIVTDLDGIVADQVEANRRGSLIVIHAHGDNTEALRKWAPQFSGSVLATTQAAPFGRVHNFGGFTDGDRAVLLARHFRAAQVAMVGFDFERANPKDDRPEVKRRKLAWAKRLIRMVDKR